MLTLSSLQDEGHTIPPLILDVYHKGAESWAAGVGRDGIIVEIARLCAIERFRVLANNDILWLDSGDAAQNSDLSHHQSSSGSLLARLM